MGVFFRRLMVFVWAVTAVVFSAWPSASALAATAITTNDTFSGKQWYLDAIHAREGWAASTGSSSVIVAVIDSGVDPEHPDIRPNLWINANEIPGNKKDDDGDGYADDVNGWNFVNGTNDVRPVYSADGIPEAWVHGTVVASLIAAAGNNDIGISGVAWKARIMPLAALGSDGYGQDEDVVAAIRYAVTHGADIINLSFVGAEYNEGLEQAVNEATSQGVLVVSAAGNSDRRAGDDLDLTPGYPACDKGAAGRGTLTVSALTAKGQKASFANFGSCVDVSAPGEGMFAARPGYAPATNQPAPGYADNLSGTSVAAPLVSGLAVLLKAKHPHWKADELAQRIKDTADPFAALPGDLKGKMGSGAINVARALQDDDASRRLGPFYLEAAAVGRAPEVRVMGEDGKEISRFYVGDTGDKRGIRAAFVRWTGSREPEIAISMIGDAAGAWRVYRTDGVLVAAGTLGQDVKGGLYLAAQDLDNTGQDVLFLGEAAGQRAWLVSAKSPTPKVFEPFGSSDTRGISALSVDRPVASFLVASRYGEGQIAIIGKDGQRLAWDKIADKTAPKEGWLVRRAADGKGGQSFDIISVDGRVVLVNDATGLKTAEVPMSISRWDQVPEGITQKNGWRFFETWPR